MTLTNNFHIKDTYQIRPEPAYCDDTYIDRLYQPDVYALARSYGAPIIDVGCGQGHHYADHVGKVTGIDYGANLEACRQRFPQHTWIEHDLETGLPPLHHSKIKNAVVICADVIEHLVDPTAVLEGLAKWAKWAKAIIISTPDRIRVYGHDHDGPPNNPGHVREWTEAEFLALLSDYFTVESLTHTNVDNVRGSLETLTAVCRAK